jgi:hypothetical protein
MIERADVDGGATHGHDAAAFPTEVVDIALGTRNITMNTVRSSSCDLGGP